MKKEVKNATMMPRLTKFMFVVGFLLTTIMSYANNLAYAQNQTFTFHLKNVSIKTVLQTIEKQSEFIFMYRSDLLDTSKKVSVDADKKSVSQILDQILEGTAVTYEINDRQIVLKKTEIINNQSSGPQQSKRIYGVVKDEAGETVIGANVWVKGTTTGVVTDIDGRYQITLNDPKAILVFSYLGMKTQEVVVGNKLEINIVLVPDAERLDEVVVVGYGVQKKVNLSGSVSTIDVDKLTDSRPVVNISQILSGMAAGLQVTSSNNRPGNDDATFLIRGQGTMNNSSPLIIIDGVESSISSVLPQDIDNISVLKDAASAAIYGSRAANGVILITTKKGKAGSIKIDYNGYVSRESINKPKYITPVSNYADYMELMNEGLSNSGLNAPFSQETIDIWRTNEGIDPIKYPNTDYIDAIFKTATSTNHVVSLRGGNEKIMAYASVGYTNNPGVLENSGVKKYNGRFNLDANIKSWLSLGMQLNGYIQDQETGTSQIDNVFVYAGNTTPGMYLRTSDGRYGTTNNNEDLLCTNNLLKFLNQTKGNYRQEYLRSRFYATFKPFKGLSVTGSYSNERWSQYNEITPVFIDLWNFLTESVAVSGQSESYVNNSYSKYERNYWDVITNYENRFFNNQLGLKIMAGLSSEQYLSKSFSANKKDLIDLSLDVINATTGSASATGTRNDWAMCSYFGRINLDWKERYLLEFNLRSDGSSRFSPENRWGWFPSFSAAWRISEEPFLESVVNKGLTNLKLRISYGSLGNNSVDNYAYQSVFSAANYVLNNAVVTGMAKTSLANENIKWESTYITDVGVDFGLFNGKMNGTIDYFYKDTKNILIDLPAPDVHGTTTLPTQNAARVSNKGFEVSLGWHDVVGDFQYSVNGNFTCIKNKVEKYKGTDASGRSLTANTVIWEGHPLNAHYLLTVDRILQTDEDMQIVQDMINNAPVDESGEKINPFAAYGIPQKGDFLYKDMNNDGIINDEDKTLVSDGITPKIYYGLTLSASWKGLDFSTLLQGVAKVKAYWCDPMFNTSSVRYGYQINKYVADNRWYEGRTDATYPRLTNYLYKLNEQPNTHYLFNKAYLKIRNIQLGYTFPNVFTEKFNLDRFRVYVSLENFFTFTKYKGFDPEVTNMAYPTLRQAVFGINVSF